MAVEPTRDGAQPYVETPELEERIDRVGFLLAAGATIMFFLSFVFAYFYLRSLNNAGQWKPAGVDPPDGWGIAIAACFVLSALVFWLGARTAGRSRAWFPAAGAALVLGLAGCVLQALEYANLPFGPQSGGYASVFFGWTALYTVVVLLAMYRLETAFAAGLRHRRNRDYPPPPGLLSGAWFWALLAAIGLLAWILLYLV